MKHFRKIFLACCILSANSLFGQLEQKNWFFGDRQGLNFTTSGPTYDNSALVNNTINTQEICVTQSDAAGNLLFYSNGDNIWDGNHTLAGTGIGGDQSSASGVISIPDPANANRYYLIMVSVGGGPKYRLVTHLGGGSISLGPVATFPSGGTYNASYGEGVTGIAGCNGNYWVIIKGYSTSGVHSLLSFSLTSSGLSFNSGTPLWLDTYYTSMEASPDGTHVALGAFSGMNRLVMFDFDKFTGTFTNQRLVGTEYEYAGSWPYGLQFSPDSKLLYTFVEGSGRLFQYSTTDPNPGATGIQVGTVAGPPGQRRTTLQLGLDGKIYVPQPYTTQLSVINNPNNLSTILSPNNCNFSNTGFSVPSGSIQGGLPNMLDANKFSAFANTISYNLYNCLTAGFIPNVCAQSYSWNFGDPASGSANSSTLNSPFHTFTSPGVYTVTLNAGGMTITTNVTVDFNLSISGADSVCISATGNASYTVGALAPGQTVSWSVSGGTATGSSTQSVFGVNWTSLPGTVIATVSDSYGCSSSVSYTVSDGCYVPPCSCNAEPNFKVYLDEKKCGFKFEGMNNAPACMDSVVYTWDFGDGSTYTGQFPYHTFPANGTYDVCLTVTAYYNGDVCKKERCEKVEVKCMKEDCDCKLSPSFDYSIDLKTCTVTFYGQAGAPECLNPGYTWDFGDGYTATGQTVSHVYTTPGYYYVCVYVNAFNGTTFCDKKYCQEITVDCAGKPKPQSASAGIQKPVHAEVYPNPASSEVTVSLNKISAGTVIVRIFGTDGKLLSVHEQTVRAGKQSLPVMLPQDAANGMLMMEVEADGEVSVHRISVIR